MGPWLPMIFPNMRNRTPKSVFDRLLAGSKYQDSVVYAWNEAIAAEFRAFFLKSVEMFWTLVESFRIQLRQGCLRTPGNWWPDRQGYGNIFSLHAQSEGEFSRST